MMKINTAVAYTFFVIFMIPVVFFLVHNANWLVGDQMQFLKTTAISKVLPVQNYIVPSSGRFFPLGLMDYNLLLFFRHGNSATSHFILNAICFIIFVVSLLLLLCKIATGLGKNNLNSWIIVCTLIFLSQRVYSIFLDVIFPERSIVTLLAVFMLFTWQFYKTDRWSFGIIALICAIYITYCKEPIFAALLVFALTNILFNWKNLSRNNRVFQSILAINSFVFIILYYFLIYCNISNMYTGNHGESNWIEIFFRMFWSHKIMIIAILLLFPRIYQVLVKKNKAHLFYDGLLFSGLCYFFLCLILKLNYTYYYLPAVIIVTPSIVYWLLYYMKSLVTLIVMGGFMLFYIIKFPAEITENQCARKSIYPKIEILANYLTKGYKLIWYNPNVQDDSWNSGLRNWKKAALKSYIAFVLKDENQQFDFVVLSSFSEKQNYNKVLIFYPAENDLINKKSAMQFKIQTKQSFDTIAQLNNVIILATK